MGLWASRWPSVSSREATKLGLNDSLATDLFFGHWGLHVRQATHKFLELSDLSPGFFGGVCELHIPSIF